MVKGLVVPDANTDFNRIIEISNLPVVERHY